MQGSYYSVTIMKKEKKSSCLDFHEMRKYKELPASPHIHYHKVPVASIVSNQASTLGHCH